MVYMLNHLTYYYHYITITTFIATVTTTITTHSFSSICYLFVFYFWFPCVLSSFVYGWLCVHVAASAYIHTFALVVVSLFTYIFVVYYSLSFRNLLTWSYSLLSPFFPSYLSYVSFVIGIRGGVWAEEYETGQGERGGEEGEWSWRWWSWCKGKRVRWVMQYYIVIPFSLILYQSTNTNISIVLSIYPSIHPSTSYLQNLKLDSNSSSHDRLSVFWNLTHFDQRQFHLEKFPPSGETIRCSLKYLLLGAFALGNSLNSAKASNTTPGIKTTVGSENPPPPPTLTPLQTIRKYVCSKKIRGSRKKKKIRVKKWWNEDTFHACPAGYAAFTKKRGKKEGKKREKKKSQQKVSCKNTPKVSNLYYVCSMIVKKKKPDITRPTPIRQNE